MITTYLSNKLLDHAFGVDDFTMPTSVEVALWSGDPNTAGTEVTGGGYQRQELTMSAASSRVSQNSADLTFDDLPTEQQVTHVVILDDDDNQLDTTALAIPFQADLESNTLTVEAGSLRVGLGTTP